MKELLEIQQKFTSAKTLHNEFANFDYRNLEVMLKDLKPILQGLGCIITFNDEIVCIGNHNYLKSVCTITNTDGESASSTAFAREDESRSGNCAPQLTGSASTYCRRYALCGLVAVDSGETDPDAMDNRPNNATIPAPKTNVPPQKDDVPWPEKLKAFCTEQLKVYDDEEAHVQLRAFYSHAKPQTFRGNKWGPQKLWEWFVKDVHDGKIQIDDADPKHPKVTVVRKEGE